MLDWPTLWREGLARGARWMVLEHDKPKDPVRLRPGEPRNSCCEPRPRPEEASPWSPSSSASSAAATSATPISRARAARSWSRSRPCADLVPAARRGAGCSSIGVAAARIDELLADPEIDDRHQSDRAAGARRGQPARGRAGKHVYSEKPLAATLRRGARAGGRRARQGRARSAARPTPSSAPATRRRAGASTRAGSAAVVGGDRRASPSHGMESWHPNPAFFFKRGGGPVLDIGPYSDHPAGQLLGPGRERRRRTASRGFATRTVTSEPRRGEVIEVEVPTTVNGVLAFANGANVALTVSAGTSGSTRRLPIELYGTEGTLLEPGPELLRRRRPRLGAQRRLAGPRRSSAPVRPSPTARTTPAARSPTTGSSACSTWRCAIAEGRPHRANGDLALHVLEVLRRWSASSIKGRESGSRPSASARSRCRPAPMRRWFVTPAGA